jgi:hypothetical protein
MSRDLWIVFCLYFFDNILPRKGVVFGVSFDAIGRNYLVGDEQPLTQDAQQLSTVHRHAGSVLYTGSTMCSEQFRGRILGRNWDKSLKSFPPCYSQSSLLMDFAPPPLGL